MSQPRNDASAQVSQRMIASWLESNDIMSNAWQMFPFERERDQAALTTEPCAICGKPATTECSVCHSPLCEEHEFQCPNRAN